MIGALQSLILSTYIFNNDYDFVFGEQKAHGLWELEAISISLQQRGRCFKVWKPVGKGSMGSKCSWNEQVGEEGRHEEGYLQSQQDMQA